MNDSICDFRFAICDLDPELPNYIPAPKDLSLTPRFSGVGTRLGNRNRFSGFQFQTQTAKAVRDPQQCPVTLLKQGVNEKCICKVPIMKQTFVLLALMLLFRVVAFAADYNLGELAKANKLELFNRSFKESKTDSPETISLSAAPDDGLAWIKEAELSE